MKSQALLVLGTLALSVVLASVTQAGWLFGRRQSYSTSRPVYTYRPTTTQTVRPAVQSVQQPAATPATVQPVSAEAAAIEQPSVKQAVASEATFHPTILSMLQRNNAVRTSRGMRPMRLSSRLTAAAQNHANYMARTGSFSHYTNGGPQGRVAAHGFRGGVRENIAMGQPSVDSAFDIWTASSGHYANMMSHSDVAGFGYAIGANGQPYWVAVYGNNDGGN